MIFDFPDEVKFYDERGIERDCGGNSVSGFTYKDIHCRVRYHKLFIYKGWVIDATDGITDPDLIEKNGY